MYLTKKQWTIIAIIGGLVAIYFLFIKKNKMSESSFNPALPLIGDEGAFGTYANRSTSNNYVPMTKSTTYPKQDPGKGNKWCCGAYGEDGNCKQWVITPMSKKC